MAVQGVRVSVGTAATLLSAADSDTVAGTSVLVRVPTGGTAIDVGGPTVATGAGFAVAAGESVSFDLDPGETLHGITASGTSTVHVLRRGQ